MGVGDLNIGLRFLLELAALAALGYWGWTTRAGLARPVLAIGLPVLAATLWGVFRVAGDGGDPVVAVPGVARLALELALLGVAVAALAAADRPTLAGGLAAVVAVHYLVAYDRVLWLVRGAPLD